jgi:hypothetical protein
MQEERTRQQRVTLIIGIVVGALVLGAVVLFIVRSIIYSANLRMSIAPNNATITLNGKKIKNKNQQIRPGDYVLRVEREGFDAEEEEFSVAKGETHDVLIALLPSDGNYEWYKENERDQIIFDGMITRKQDEAMREAYESDPIMRILPYTDTSFGLTFIVEASYNDGIELLIRLNTCSDMVAENYKERALLWIASQGFRPENYHITYVTLCN